MQKVNNKFVNFNYERAFVLKTIVTTHKKDEQY